MNKERGIIIDEGMGGFLNPPTHPEHSRSVQFDLRRRKENRGSCSLTSAVTSEWLHDETRAAAKRILDSWQRPSLDSPEVQEWILNVLGFFRGCYKGDGPETECWNAAHLRVSRETDPMLNADIHAGVRLIREYYPEFQPTPEHFNRAYWGTKPAA